MRTETNLLHCSYIPLSLVVRILLVFRCATGMFTSSALQRFSTEITNILLLLPFPWQCSHWDNSDNKRWWNISSSHALTFHHYSLSLAIFETLHHILNLNGLHAIMYFTLYLYVNEKWVAWWESLQNLKLKLNKWENMTMMMHWNYIGLIIALTLSDDDETRVCWCWQGKTISCEKPGHPLDIGQRALVPLQRWAGLMHSTVFRKGNP